MNNLGELKASIRSKDRGCDKNGNLIDVDEFVINLPNN